MGNKDAAIETDSQLPELERMKNNFLIKKLAVKDEPILDLEIDIVIEKWGHLTPSK